MIAIDLPLDLFDRGGGGIALTADNRAVLDADDAICHGAECLIVRNDDNGGAMLAAGARQERCKSERMVLPVS